MAVCDICGRKIGMSETKRMYKDAVLCHYCNARKQLTTKPSLTEDEKRTIFNYYKKYVDENKCTPAGNEAIKSMMPSLEYSLDEELAKELAEQKQRIEEEEKLRIAAEEEARKKREEEYRFKIDKLKEQGAKGYYEYKVVSLLDNAGLFRSNSGRIDVQAMSEILNNLGIEGWHLVTAYSNEAGKNALSGGAGGAIVGVNSTVDENILIFERFVAI